MDPGEPITGTRDEHYDLVSVLYHALHGAQGCEMYAIDAEAAGRDDLAAFFREAQGAQVGLAERAKGLLGILEGTPEVGRYSAGAIPPRTEPGLTDPADSLTTGDVPSRSVESGIGGTSSSPVPSQRAVPPDAPRTQQPPPRTGDSPPSPSEGPGEPQPG